MITTRLANERMTKIQGPAGDLQLAVAFATAAPRDAWGIICHPHPLHGGTMDNKVVTTLAKTFQALGVNTVRFNFRGVGESIGQYDQGQGELEDLMSVIDWVQREHLSQELWLAGFSFGAAIAAKASTQIPITRLVTVAPPVDHFSMKTLAPIYSPWVLVQGDQDEVISAESVYAWVETREPKPKVISIKEAGHFFHGQLGVLRAELETVLK